MPPTLWQIAILAAVQGLAEFLPVSSSGHVVIFASWLGVTSEITDLNIVLHFGTLLSILVFYFHQVWRLLGDDRWTIARIVVATLPAAIIGVGLKAYLQPLLESPLLAGCMLVVTGSVLLAARKLPEASGTYQKLSYGRCALVGVAQAFALLPGISRSGMTISAGMAAGLSKSAATTFSFLMAIAAIGGASALELKDIFSGESSPATSPLHLACGAAIAFAVGLASLWWLNHWVQRGRLHLFAYWCIPVGIIAVMIALFSSPN